MAVKLELLMNIDTVFARSDWLRYNWKFTVK